MRKLITHLVVALALWFTLAHFGAAVWLRCLGIVVGFFLVHWVWERLFFNPFLYLGAMPVADDDPIMLSAKQQGAATLPTLRALFPDNREGTAVRFALPVNSGKREMVWGDLLEITETTAKVYLRTPPIEEADIPDRHMTIAIADIDDWQVELRDGTIRGGYTILAMMRIFEREEGYLHPAIREQKERFRNE